MRNFSIAIFLLFCLPSTIYAQERVLYGGFFPEMALSHSFTEKYSSTFKIESQHITFNNEDSEPNTWRYAQSLTDFQLFGGLKLSPFWKTALGYQYRVESEAFNSHRFIQQVAFVQNSRAVRFGHRVRTDQTFEPEVDMEFRIRYRFSSEIPMEGLTLDPQEFYLILSDEIIYSIQSWESEIENRLVGSLGYFFSKKSKLEAGLDWRIDRLVAPGIRNRLWFKVGYFLNI